MNITNCSNVSVIGLSSGRITIGKGIRRQSLNGSGPSGDQCLDAFAFENQLF